MTTIRRSPSRGPESPEIIGVYEPDTRSVQYIAADPATRKAALIDVVLDFDPRHARTGTTAAQGVLQIVEAEGLEIVWLLDTHPHADHLMASAWLKERLGAPAAIGAGVREIAALWARLYNLPNAFDPEVSVRADRSFAVASLLGP